MWQNVLHNVILLHKVPKCNLVEPHYYIMWLKRLLQRLSCFPDKHHITLLCVTLNDRPLSLSYCSILAKLRWMFLPATALQRRGGLCCVGGWGGAGDIKMRQAPWHFALVAMGDLILIKHARMFLFLVGRLLHIFFALAIQFINVHERTGP